jgi:hypothetical protein
MGQLVADVPSGPSLTPPQESKKKCLPRLGVCGREPSTETAASAKQGSPPHWQFFKLHAGLRFAHGFQTSVHTRI